ncbi:hypothetical protein CUB97_04710 [Prevotella intermedia]|uniref:Uncharacterized protein n=1 Tax=Prevotella intermedia TaxID=28131 RepID=A0A2M8M8S9_PREIN|nr:hypothetical protein CUB97_04710 [Prevotella intermedia]
MWMIIFCHRNGFKSKNNTHQQEIEVQRFAEKQPYQQKHHAHQWEKVGRQCDKVVVPTIVAITSSTIGMHIERGGLIE